MNNPKQSYYVGITHTNTYELFSSDSKPKRSTYGKWYKQVYGPFKSHIEGLKWARKRLLESHGININPKDLVEIYDRIESIEARKGKNSLWPNEKFIHKFKSRSKAKVYGLPNGDLLISSDIGKSLWKEFDY